MWTSDHIVLNGKMYLRVQTTRPSGLVVTYVDFDRWDAAKVQEFRADHPELEPYWPEPSRADGGVTWLRTSEK